MGVEVFVNFDGNCREAVEFYAEVFKTEKQRIMLFGDGPPNSEFPFPEEAKSLVMHTQLNINGSNVMFSDIPPGMPFVKGNNLSLVILSKNKDEIRASFNKLKDGGTVGMELQETFWSKLYGFVTDKFGVGWQFNYCGEQIGM
ncbi:MAG: VOC family protein [Desulfosporosinus sp.]|nr:VOC family protein [Desulfosporosinus sp.]